MDSEELVSHLFISVEGIEGSGKSTFIPHIGEIFQELNYNTLITKCPGGTSLGKNLRDHVLGKNDEIYTNFVDILLMIADQAHLIENRVKPFFKENSNSNAVVITDRFIDSAYIYQAKDKASEELIELLDKRLFNELRLDYTILLLVKPDIAFERINSRKKEYNRLNEQALDKLEDYSMKYFQRYSKDYSNRIITIDASKSLDEMKLQLKNKLNLLLQKGE